MPERPDISIGMVAKLLGVSRSRADDVSRTDLLFPAPHLKWSGSQRERRWYQNEVEAFAFSARWLERSEGKRLPKDYPRKPKSPPTEPQPPESTTAS